MSVKNIINKILRKFNLELHGTNYLQALAKGDFKQDEMNIFEKVFGNAKITIYDVGANRGVMIKSFLSTFPNASIHAFEPYKSFCDDLTQKYVLNKNIVINNLGISEHESELVFNINKSVDTSSFLTSQKTGLNCDAQVETVSQIKVPVTTIDKYSAYQLHERINILKLDIQGSELNALKGAENLLKNKRIDMIFCETYFVQQYAEQPLFLEIASYLLQYDYILQDIYHPIYGNGKLAWCDSMFIRNDFKIG
jgi:FkbM family methyltransferase